MPGGDALYFDTETFSDVPIKYGPHAYFASPAAQIMVAAWAWDDEPVKVEDLTRVRNGEVKVTPPSDALLDALTTARTVVIQNSAFDRAGTRACWKLEIDVRRVHDTMVQAMTHSLPGSLGALGQIFALDDTEAKDAEGKNLIRLFTMPRPKNMNLRRATKETHPAEWQRFLSYAGSDITSMRALRSKMPIWNYRDTNQHRERSLWELDQKSNDRGFLVDVDLARKAISTIKDEQKLLAAETAQLTDGEVDKASRRDAMLTHIAKAYDVELPDLKKDTLERRVADPETPDALRQLLRVRLATSTTSTAKYQAVLRSQVNGQLFGTTAFCGALRTGRWAGRLFQPQNLPRPDMKPHEVEAAIRALQADALDLVSAQVMRALSNILRGLIIARPGRKLVCSDLEQIESRGSAWLAGEQWKLDAIAEYDAGDGFDNYVMAFSMAFGVTPEEVLEDKKRNGWWRQVGKVMELAQSYEGGVAAWLAFAMVYRLELNVMAEEAYPRLPRKAREQAEIIWDWRRKKQLSTFGLDRRTFVVIEAFKSLWRQAHPAYADKETGIWGRLDRASKEAVRHPKQEIEVGKLAFEKRGAWLRMILPSGRVLCYPSPQLEVKRGREVLTYAGVNQYSRKWSRIQTYGGKLFENATQALARDVMAANMLEIEETGYRILLTVHDEVITEPDDRDDLTADRLSAILAKNPPWLQGCPLAASGFEADRYRKD